jgi:hypothetical protein
MPPIRYRHVTAGVLHFHPLAIMAGPVDVTRSGFQIELKIGDCFPASLPSMLPGIAWQQPTLETTPKS